tara:strand:+ start:450 stop:791 length:342 start_codon:yes stop_codon:yes gene_type:complete
MKFNELSNEELVFTSLLMKDMIFSYTDIIEAGGLQHAMYSPLGKVLIFKKLSIEEQSKLETSDKLKILKSITNKLKPIVELILDSKPNMEAELEEILFGIDDIEYNGEEDEEM